MDCYLIQTNSWAGTTTNSMSRAKTQSPVNLEFELSALGKPSKAGMRAR